MQASSYKEVALRETRRQHTASIQRHPELRKLSESKDPVKLPVGSAAGFLDSARNDGVADLKLGVSMNAGDSNLELSRRLANSLFCKPSIALIFAFLSLPASQNSEE